MAQFTLHSPTFHGQVPTAHVYHDFGAGGDNQSPALSWSDAPAGTKSYLLVLHDVDAPGPGGWWHWCAFNIPADVSELALDASQQGMPTGTVQVKNSYGSIGFGGACPPPGDQGHTYLMTLYALDTEKLELDENTSPAMVLFVANAHVLGKAGLVAYYAR
ncbi:MAG: YbhB/YbcL family Raf kinase inhibitor-like protein [Bacteroidota bacterium]